MSGQELFIDETGCYYNDIQVLKFSKNYINEIHKYKEKGYIPVKATIRHIVYWRGDEEDEEVKIVLPEVEFRKHS
jgi:ATP-dependent DNA helicase RecQ